MSPGSVVLIRAQLDSARDMLRDSSFIASANSGASSPRISDQVMLMLKVSSQKKIKWSARVYQRMHSARVIVYEYVYV
jgi:hypothetical protein